MILLFDVGNTNICFAKASGEKLFETFRINTELTKTADEYYISIKQLIDLSDISGIAIASVVPRITECLKEISLKFLKIEPLIINPGIKTGISIKTDYPKEVGADIICASVAVMNFEKPVLIIDLGTANKYIYVKDKRITGVTITPGVLISIKALVGNTALLPDIDISVPKKILGTNTIAAMQSGATYGTAAQLEGLIKRIKLEVNEEFIVIVTGGLATTILPLISTNTIHNQDLVLEGLLNIYHKNN